MVPGIRRTSCNWLCNLPEHVLSQIYLSAFLLQQKHTYFFPCMIIRIEIWFNHYRQSVFESNIVSLHVGLYSDPSVCWCCHVRSCRFAAGKEGDFIKGKWSDQPKSSSVTAILLLGPHGWCRCRSAWCRWWLHHGASLLGARCPSAGKIFACSSLCFNHGVSLF